MFEKKFNHGLLGPSTSHSPVRENQSRVAVCFVVFKLTRSSDLVTFAVMKTMPISEFKTHCISLLKEAQRKQEPLMITWRAHPLARIEPVYDNPAPRRFGAVKGRMLIKGDIVKADFDDEWEQTV